MENITVRYSTTQRRLVEIAIINVLLLWMFPFFVFKLIISIPFLLAMGFSIWYMESFGLDFEPETGNLCYHTALSKPYYFHVSEIQKISFQNIRTKSGERLFLSIHPPCKQILIILGEPSNSGGFDETWDSYTNASELLDFLQRYQKTEGT